MFSINFVISQRTWHTKARGGRNTYIIFLPSQFLAEVKLLGLQLHQPLPQLIGFLPVEQEPQKQFRKGKLKGHVQTVNLCASRDGMQMRMYAQTNQLHQMGNVDIRV